MGEHDAYAIAETKLIRNAHWDIAFELGQRIGNSNAEINDELDSKGAERSFSDDSG